MLREYCRGPGCLREESDIKSEWGREVFRCTAEGELAEGPKITY